MLAFLVVRKAPETDFQVKALRSNSFLRGVWWCFGGVAVRLLHGAFALLVTVAMLVVTLPTSAQPYPPVYIKRLGRAPITSPLPSTARLRASRRLLLQAARKLHLTPGEYDALDAELIDPKVLQYGAIPKHIEAMTSGPPPFHVIHNVYLLTKQYGWHLAY